MVNLDAELVRIKIQRKPYKDRCKEELYNRVFPLMQLRIRVESVLERNEVRKGKRPAVQRSRNLVGLEQMRQEVVEGCPCWGLPVWNPR